MASPDACKRPLLTIPGDARKLPVVQRFPLTALVFPDDSTIRASPRKKRLQKELQKRKTQKIAWRAGASDAVKHKLMSHTQFSLAEWLRRQTFEICWDLPA